MENKTPLLQHLAQCLSPRMRRARRKAHAYDHIVPLGINCEAAFRFYDTWGFVDSSLFAWAQCFDLTTLTAALGNLDGLFADAVELDPASRMWICRNTGIYLHGQLKMGGSEPTPEEINTDREALLGRVTYLKQKFYDYATDEQSTLFVHRLFQNDQSGPELGDRLAAVSKALERLGARNWQLLVVCEQPFLGRMPPLPHVTYRAVRHFNPGSAITDTKLGDRIGWRAVYTEFAPAKILPKKHAFKFE